MNSCFVYLGPKPMALNHRPMRAFAALRLLLISLPEQDSHISYQELLKAKLCTTLFF